MDSNEPAGPAPGRSKSTTTATGCSSDTGPTCHGGETCGRSHASNSSGSTSSAVATHARPTAEQEPLMVSRNRLSAMSSSELLLRCAHDLFFEKIRPPSGQMLLGLGGDFDLSLSRLVTLCCPSDCEPVALALTISGTACSCSPAYPTPTASLFGCKDVPAMLARRERMKSKHGNGNGFGLTLGQYCATHKIDLTPGFVEKLMGFPPDWTDARTAISNDCEGSATPSCPRSPSTSDD